MHEQIKLYRRLGWSIIPIMPNGKYPCSSLLPQVYDEKKGETVGTWKPYTQAHAADEEVKRWFRQPGINIGIVTGALSGIVVLDTDNRAAMDYLRQRGASRLSMPLSKTAKGWHMFFKHPGFEVKTTSGLFGIPGLDIRGDKNGYVVAPPSIHSTGFQYQWALPADTPLPELPDFILEAIKPAPAPVKQRDSVTVIQRDAAPKSYAGTTSNYARAALLRNIDLITRAPEGQRNDRLNDASFNMGQIIYVGEIDQATVEHELSSAAASVGLSGLEVDRTIASGIKGGMADGSNFAVRLYEAREKMFQRRQLQRQSAPSRTAAAAPAPANSADMTVYLQYISELAGDIVMNGAYLVKSPIGTGKTELVKRVVDRLEKQLGYAPKVLYITHRIALSQNVSDRLVFEMYQGLTGQQRAQISKLVITVNSLLTLPAELPRYDVVIIDEIEQLLPHLGGETFRGAESVNCHEILRHLVKYSGLVLCLDAHAGAISLNWLKSIRNDVQFVVNSYAHQKKDLTVIDSKTALIARADAAIAENAGAVVIATSSRNQARALYQRYRKMIDPALIRVIYSGNSMAKDTQHFLQNINQELPKIKLLIYSPSIGTGVDITCPVHAVFGLFGRNPITAGDMLQMLGRSRHALRYEVHLPQTEASNPLESDPRAIYRREREKALRTAAHVERYIGADGLQEVTPGQQRLLSLLSQVAARRNVSFNNLLKDFSSLAEEQYNLIFVSAADDEEIKEQMKAARQANEERDKNLALTVDPVDPDKLQDLNGRGEATPIHFAGEVRWQIENTYKQTITPELYDHFDSGRGRAKLLNFCALMDEHQKVVKIDEHQITYQDNFQQKTGDKGTAIHQRRHASKQRELGAKAIRAVWGKDAKIHDLIRPVEEETIINAMTAYLESYGDDLKLYFQRRASYSNDPIDLLRWIFARFGLHLELIRNCKDEGKYRVSKSSLQEMVVYAQIRTTAIQRETAEKANQRVAHSTRSGSNIYKIAETRSAAVGE